MMESSARSLGAEHVENKKRGTRSKPRPVRDGLRRTAEISGNVARTPVYVSALAYVGGKMIYEGASEKVAPVIDIFRPKTMNLSEVYPQEEYAKIVAKADKKGQPIDYIRTITFGSQTETDKGEGRESTYRVTYYPQGLSEDVVPAVGDYYTKLAHDENDVRNRFGLSVLKEPERMVTDIMCKEGSAVLLAQSMDTGDIVGTAVINTSPKDGYSDFAFDVSKEDRHTGLGRALRTDSLGFAKERGIEEVHFDIYAGNVASVRSMKSVDGQADVPWSADVQRPVCGMMGGRIFYKASQMPERTQ